MKDLSAEEFLKELSPHCRSIEERAVALLWYCNNYSNTRDLTAAEIAQELLVLGFSRPRVDRLDATLKKSPYVVRGMRIRSYAIDLGYLDDLYNKYAEILNQPRISSIDHILPSKWFEGGRSYHYKIQLQINGAFDSGYYDCCAVLIRRLMEMLIIESYINNNISDSIKDSDDKFILLDKLIEKYCGEKSFHRSRGIKNKMLKIKGLGDIAAHDRVYIVTRKDIENLELDIRTVIHELMTNI